jgi:uncharacterized membrane protein YgdD (TMEM256/DUF423 family)
MKFFVVLGSLNAFLAVALGAFGAHGLKSKVSADMLTVWQTGVQYHMFHALGLILPINNGHRVKLQVWPQTLLG